MLKGQKKGEKSGINHNCLSCKKGFYVYPYKVNTSRGLFCSKKCINKGRLSSKRTGIFKSCVMCSSKFYAPKWLMRVKGAKYCSKVCYWESKIGKKPWNDEGKTSINERIRKSVLYKTWRLSVFKRDDFTCQECYVRGGELNADHIKQFALFPKLRLELSNGRTLCISCHRKTDTYGRLGVNT